MTLQFRNSLLRKRVVGISIAAMSLLSSRPVCAAESMKSLKSEFVVETGCPIQAAATPRADLELDNDHKPVAARQYLDYKNVSDRTVVAVKFRIGFVDSNGLATVMQGIDTQQVAPGRSAWQRWRSEVSGPTKAAKVRVMAVKFADGTFWVSEKAQGPTSSSAGEPPVSAAPASAAVPTAGLAPASQDIPPPAPVPEDVFPI